MKHIIGLLAMLLPIFCGAQSSPVRALSIGDTVPDITLTNVYNYPDSVIRLSDLKGKLVILDFWATWCNGCVLQLPLLDSIQKEFDDNLKIFLISNEGGKSEQINEYKIKEFYKKWANRTGELLSLPTTLESNHLLNQLFHHVFIPHYVWLSDKMQIIAITSSEEVNRENIREVLNGLPVNMNQKSDKPFWYHQN